MERKVFQDAVKAFERMFHCRVCYHDYTMKLATGLLPTMHINPYCTAAKRLSRHYERDCILFDKSVLPEALLKQGCPVFKRCPMDLLECAFPIYREGELSGALFAGPFMCRELPGSFVLASRNHFPKRAHLVPPLPEPPEDLESFLAFGRALACLLSQISQKRALYPGNAKETIEDFLNRNYMTDITLEHMAELLSMTSARASSRVKKELGKGFSELLNEQRVNAARRFLENTSFSAENIARLSGFKTAPYFHRVFRQRMGMTPQEYRRRHSRQEEC